MRTVGDSHAFAVILAALSSCKGAAKAWHAKASLILQQALNSGALGAMLSRIAWQSMNQTRSPRKHANRGRFTCFRGDLGSLEFLQRIPESMAPKSILNS